MRIRDPKTTALIFASGRMVCTGAKSEEMSETACKQYAKAIVKAGIQGVTLSGFTIQNIVGSHDVGFHIKLESLRKTAEKISTYEPEMFPGLIFRMPEPNLVLLIFSSGKIVLTGAKERKQIYSAYKNIRQLLEKHKQEEAHPKQPGYVERILPNN